MLAEREITSFDAASSQPWKKSAARVSHLSSRLADPRS